MKTKLALVDALAVESPVEIGKRRGGVNRPARADVPGAEEEIAVCPTDNVPGPARDFDRSALHVPAGHRQRKQGTVFPRTFHWRKFHNPSNLSPGFAEPAEESVENPPSKDRVNRPSYV
jgi:hypothetical protein